MLAQVGARTREGLCGRIHLGSALVLGNCVVMVLALVVDRALHQICEEEHGIGVDAAVEIAERFFVLCRLPFAQEAERAAGRGVAGRPFSSGRARSLIDGDTFERDLVCRLLLEKKNSDLSSLRYLYR